MNLNISSHNIFVFFDILIIICLFVYIFINNMLLVNQAWTDSIWLKFILAAIFHWLLFVDNDFITALLVPEVYTFTVCYSENYFEKYYLYKISDINTKITPAALLFPLILEPPLLNFWIKKVHCFHLIISIDINGILH